MLSRFLRPTSGPAGAVTNRSDRPAPPEAWNSLPLPARCFVASVVALGALALLAAVPQIGDGDAPMLTALAVLSLLAAFAKTALAVPGSASSLSFCYVIDFMTLLVLGPAPATLTTAVGVWAQGTFRVRNTGPRYRTWFSIAALALTVQASSFTYSRLGGQVAAAIVPSFALSLAAAATVYFLANSLLVAGAVALTTRKRTLTVWWTNYASLWPGHLLGCSVAIAAAAGITRSPLWLLPFALTIVGLTYEKLHAYVEGLSQSLVDAMTELPNLRYLRAHAPQEIDRARREQKPVAVLMIDLVDFKSINDTYGHRAGDVALREVARRLQGSVRSYDICARYAGDEFVVVLPGCPAEEAQVKAAALQRAVAETRFSPASGVVTPLEISVGVAIYPEQGTTFDELLSAADAEMFAHKRRAARRDVRSRSAAPALGRGFAAAV